MLKKTKKKKDGSTTTTLTLYTKLHYIRLHCAMGISKADQKYEAKQNRRRGLQKTRLYCQICERQCLDEHGYGLHVQSERHLRKTKELLGEHGGRMGDVVSYFSEQFDGQFVRLLRVGHGRKRVMLNQVYQEMVGDKNARVVHLNATRWRSLGGYARYLQGRAGVECEMDDEGLWWVQWKGESGKDKFPSQHEVEQSEDVPIENVEEVGAVGDVGDVGEGGETHDLEIENLSPEKEAPAVVTAMKTLTSRTRVAFGLKKKNKGKK